MSRNPRYDILFESVRIGPVTAPNRFYQAPHAMGTGNQMPHTRAAMREVRAEGGWGVVNTGYCSIHPSSDDTLLPYSRLWDDEDIEVHALMVDAVHRHGALAGVELWHGGSETGNRLTRVTPMSASGVSYNLTYPGWMSLTRSRPMDRQDIREFRRWHVDAAKRAKSAGFDIVYIYAGMGFGPYQFLLPSLNKRTDEYGGSLVNRMRFIVETLSAMRNAVGDETPLGVRLKAHDQEEGGMTVNDYVQLVTHLEAMGFVDYISLTAGDGGLHHGPMPRPDGEWLSLVREIKRITKFHARWTYYRA